MTRSGAIQYLRAVAALGVVSYHIVQWRGGGFDIGRAGVDIFFVISGVIMWSVTAGRPSSPAAFAWKRLTRVAPTYWLATLVVATIAALWPQLLTQVRPGPLHMALSLAFIPHLDLAGLPFPVLPAGWTLCYEALFYGLFALGLLAPEKDRAAILTATLGSIAALGLGLGGDVYILIANPMLLEFAAGLWIACAAGRGTLPNRAWGGMLLLAGFGLLALEQPGGLFTELWRPMLWGLPAAMIVAGVVSLGAVADVPILRHLGDASYAIYLWHLPVVALIANLLGWRTPLWVLMPVALVASISAGLAGRACLEIPLQRYLRRQGRQRIAQFSNGT